MTGSSNLRTARPAEAGVLTALALRAKAHWGYSDEFMTACAAELAIPEINLRHVDWHYVVAEAGGEVIGFYALQRATEHCFELEDLFVQPTCIGIGIGVGRLLLKNATDYAANAGAKELVTQSDPHAEQFYLRCGARQTGERESASIAGRMLPLLVLRTLVEII